MPGQRRQTSEKRRERETGNCPGNAGKLGRNIASERLKIARIMRALRVSRSPQRRLQQLTRPHRRVSKAPRRKKRILVMRTSPRTVRSHLQHSSQQRKGTVPQWLKGGLHHLRRQWKKTAKKRSTGKKAKWEEHGQATGEEPGGNGGGPDQIHHTNQ